VVKFGPNVSATDKLQLGTLVGIRFLSRVCHACEYCSTGRDQHCGKSTNHLHHEDGSFQEYCVLDTKFLTELPQDIDPKTVGPALCAGVTAYKVRVESRQNLSSLTILGCQECAASGGKLFDRHWRSRRSRALCR
jgi:D-arabinose 1-dehydrogenase-like Zn-dependent alcohol dehydrogenase